jgi:serine/threonine protein kinase
VLDVGEVQGALYLAMEYVHGKDLQNVIKKLQQSRSIIPLGEACYIVREVAQALHHAYWSTDMTGQRLSVVHRDVSPQNIILSYDGTVKLLDFGVAISAVTEHAETMIVGKWLYMSPETTTNDQIDHRSDLFSLGVILYLLCSGYMPFTGREPKEIVKKIRAGQYKPLHEIVQVPERLALLVNRMLAPNPDDRPQRGQEVATELTDIARQFGIESSGPSIAYVLKQLFPDEVGGPSDYQVPTVIGPQDSKSAASLTPMLATTPASTTASRPAVDGSVSVAATPKSREFSAPVTLPSTSPSAVRPSVSPPISRQMALPVHGSAQRPVSRSRVLITVAIAILLAAGMYLLVRPS